MDSKRPLSDQELQNMINDIWVEDDEGHITSIQSLTNVKTADTTKTVILQPPSISEAGPSTSKVAGMRTTRYDQRAHQTSGNISSWNKKRPLSERELEDLANMSEDGLEVLSEEDDSNYTDEDKSDTSSSSEDFKRRLSFVQNKQKIERESNKENIATGNTERNKPPQKKFRKTRQTENEIQWTLGKDNPLSGKIPPCNKQHKVNIKGDTPMDYFKYFFPDDFLCEIVYQTNLYAHQNNKINFNLTLAELKIFLGITVMMTYIKYPRIRHYWSSEGGLRMNYIADAMTCNRYEDIRRYLHFVDSTTIPESNIDKLVRIRPVLNQLHETYHSAVDPEECMSIDEMMIPFKGRSSLKQYLPKKPKKWGYKIWVRAGTSGYVYCFEAYQGASDREEVTNLGAAGDVVVRLCHDIKCENYKIFADNLFSSIPLISYMSEQKIFYLGTARANRLQGANLLLPSEKDMKAMGRGSSSIVTSDNGISVIRWFDNNLVHTISNYAGINPTEEVRRFSRQQKKYVEIPRPYAIKMYNGHMGGVDLMDSLVALYRNYTRNRRWYMRIFYHFINVTIINCWLIWRWNNHESMDLLLFKSRIATAFIFQGESMKKKKA